MSNPFDANPHPEDSGTFEAGYQQSYSAPIAPDPQPALPPGTFDCMRSFEQAWRIFKEKPAPWLIGALVYLGIFFTLYLFGYIQFLFTIITNTDPETDEFTGPIPWASLTIFGVTMAIAIVAAALWSFVSYREAVYAVGGKRPELKDMFTYRRVGALLLVSIVVALLELLGILALFIGIFVVSFFLMFAMPAMVFEDMTVGGALKSSYEVAKNNVGQTLLLFVLVMVIGGLAGSVPFAVIFTGPLINLAVAHAYMTAAGRPVQQRQF